MVRQPAAGLVGALLATAAQAALRFTVGTPLAPEQMAQAVFARVPMPVFSAAIGVLGASAKWVAFGGMTALYLAAGAAAAPFVARTGARGAPGWVLGSALLQALVLNGREAGVRVSAAAAFGVYLATAALYVAICLGLAGRHCRCRRRARVSADAEGGGIQRGSG